VNEQMSLRRLEKVLQARGIVGLLLPPPGRAIVEWENFNLQLFSAVRLGAPTAQPNVHIVGSDHTKNAALAFQNIRERGYERIAYVGEPYRMWSYAGGFLWAQLLDRPAELRISPLLFEAEHAAQHQQTLVKWLQKERPDAILTDHPELPDMLEKAGYRVPIDIAVAAMTVLDCPD
jgi:DNA-binding LacI/PurR family transcriptional regulator